ncbi:MAG TPA: phenylalanine--tRNA ligase subunit alpha [Firmicutes bacterium]|jgi:phenylalanyl-tRNA synthetase alpha chain|nr:phenylalanine--tRNA ligase subunit alpha [Bacillota bacterium]
MQAELSAIQEQAIQEIQGATSSPDLEELRLKYFGKKGVVTQYSRKLGTLSAEERPVVGKMINTLRDHLEEVLKTRGQELARVEEEAKFERERLDVELPGRQPRRGHPHPLQLIIQEITMTFLGMGFSVAEGPEVELDFYNFEALNIPAEHPAREMHDSLYITENTLLRTHTSPVQIRTMEKLNPNPVRIIVPGRVYRRDALDATHSPIFHQIEGLLVDKDITFGDLKGVLTVFIRKFFGADREVRLRPSFFPFTEPSTEVDVSCVCQGQGCRICKNTGWIEILGAGSVHPKVLAMAKYDPEVYSGFAFGMGVERIAMLRYGITDIRHFYENDFRFLSQFCL